MPDAPVLDPQLVGRAENAHRAVLRHVLAGTDLSYRQWVALSIAAAAGRAIERHDLVARTAAGLKIDETDADVTIETLIDAERLAIVPPTNRMTLTPDAATSHRALRGSIAEIVAPVYGAIAVDDLMTAGRVLATITSELSAQLDRLTAGTPRPEASMKSPGAGGG